MQAGNCFTQAGGGVLCRPFLDQVISELIQKPVSGSGHFRINSETFLARKVARLSAKRLRFLPAAQRPPEAIGKGKEHNGCGGRDADLDRGTARDTMP